MIICGFQELDFECVVDIVDCVVIIILVVDKQVRVVVQEQGVKNLGLVKVFFIYVGDGVVIVEIVVLCEEVVIWVGEFLGLWMVLLQYNFF